jgi:leader peptidase (prepilin peptidase)/N-methyltransferase
MIRILSTLLAALLGLAFGSFLNVCLSRWPEGESVVKPRSHCRSCGRTLAWWENAPLLSWIALRGRCQTCKARISWRYPLVELSVSLLWAVVALKGLTVIEDPLKPPAFTPYIVVLSICTMGFLWLLVGLAVLDAERLWLPNWITLPGIALGFVFSMFNIPNVIHLDSTRNSSRTMTFDASQHLLYRAAFSAIFGIVVAGGMVLLIRWIYWLVRRREGIGLGDAKLMAMLGAWLGLSGALLSFAIAAVLGAVFALGMLAIPAARRGSETWAAAKLPLGTFLCVGGIISALWGQPIIAAYMRWAGL